jgi:hypothetical protein
MALGIDGEPQAGVVNGALLADAGDDVGERPALGHVVEHVVDGDERRANALAVRASAASRSANSGVSSSGGSAISIWPSAAASMSAKPKWHSPF